jgi:hypothetical protein
MSARRANEIAVLWLSLLTIVACSAPDVCFLLTGVLWGLRYHGWELEAVPTGLWWDLFLC